MVVHKNILVSLAVTAITVVHAEQNVPADSFKYCKEQANARLKKRLQEITGLNIDLDDARKTFGFPVANAAIMNLVRQCAASSYPRVAANIDKAIEDTISTYVVKVGDGTYKTGDIHSSNVDQFVKGMTVSKLRYQPQASYGPRINLNAATISNRVLRRINKGEGRSRWSSDGLNKLYTIDSVIQLIHQEIATEQSAQYQQYQYSPHTNDLNVRQPTKDDIPNSELENVLTEGLWWGKNYHSQRDFYDDLAKVEKHIEDNKKVYLKNYYVVNPATGSVEGVYSRHTLRETVQDFCAGRLK